MNTKISELENVRDGLLRGLLGLREEELELEDERTSNPIPFSDAVLIAYYSSTRTPGTICASGR